MARSISSSLAPPRNRGTEVVTGAGEEAEVHLPVRGEAGGVQLAQNSWGTEDDADLSGAVGVASALRHVAGRVQPFGPKVNLSTKNAVELSTVPSSAQETVAWGFNRRRIATASP